MKLLISTSSFDLQSNQILQKLQQQGFEIILNPYGRRLKESELLELLSDDVVGMIAGVEPITRNVLSSAKSLKIISRCGIGTDSVDLHAAAEMGIPVHITPTAPVIAVAELAVSLILASLRRIAEADRQLRTGTWKPLMGRLIASQVIGLLGYGRVGNRVGQLLKTFGAKRVAYDIASSSLFADTVSVASLDEFLAMATVVTIHIPYSKENHHLVDRDFINKMQAGSILINTSRGGIIDEEALYDALVSGHLAGAALDVFEEEPYTGKLASLPQVILTPHMGSYAREARTLMEEESAQHLFDGLVELGLAQ
ncbi:MAG: phosphoglycerate dehydrogenase [Pseudanabaena sp.]|jgi:D-3-phosphoglycerate dehydrogenase|nr:phosphoglycerate dehydrogenase [Pseudanabaena sp. M53BS1SP1A06MG]MCA6581708.1 phosphoglycerate dehydrogenase [Pseudanabaena sp. M34BS1SP1A06MG]MCA6587347.1 phosphoglycerate dehydrogenase [Pseudanabaena sp. M051S1SP1A06QC]MCA6591306.1 phosphoglycerate dehydrogenase [Pseudanabaena sp. M38BS1SP1A06MG]MCA6595379.1 phosphoglycerate dehydrogenase [Pseudanabaena sp. M046S1SP1A06QC]MCA6599556.1 phosphoglycerate dehydrogenase [Pseudanabaena sp. M57BS1SP1A06MG]MCA6605126.1 phosphoglycerate dehydroge